MVDHVDDLHDSLERKLTAYGEFLEATLLLQEALEKEEMASVKQLLTRREELIRDIDGLDRRINRHRPEGLIAPSSAITRRMGKLPEEFGRMLKQIISANQACDTIAASKCEATRKELMNLRQTEEGLQGYAQKTERIPKFLNLHT
jgi:hypothetical protein